MHRNNKSREELLAEIESLHSRIHDIEESIVLAGSITSATDKTSHGTDDSKIKKDHNEFYHSLLSRLPDIIIVHVNGLIVYANQAVTKVSGYTPEEVIGKNIYDFVANNDTSRIKNYHARRSMNEEVPEMYETKIINKSGMLVDVEVRVAIVDYLGAEGRLIVATDISESKKAALIDERFRNLAEMLPEIIYETDAEGYLTFANRVGIEIFGYDPSDTGMKIHFTKMFPPEEIEKVLNSRKRTVENNDIRRVEFNAIKKDGSVFPIMINTVPIIIDGKVAGTRGIIVDISDRKKIEEHLAAETEKLSVTLRSICDAVITIDNEDSITLMNSAAEKLTGHTFAECSGNVCSHLLSFIKEKDGMPLPPVIESIRSGRKPFPDDTEIALIRNDDSHIPVEANAAPLLGLDNTITGAVIVIRDITESRKIEENRLKTIKLESVGLLAGGIAHDFNNSLTSILGNISLARLAIPESHDINMLLIEAEKASVRAKNLTKQLLTLSMGGNPVKNSSSIKDLVSECASFVLRGSNVAYKINMPENLPRIDIDEGQIFQVLNNLIINAVQAMPGGGSVAIDGSLVFLTDNNDQFLDRGDYIKISVSDTGTGIPPEHLQKIFDPYFTTKPGGHGLGLATTYSIVTKHGGHIEVSSVPELTRFTFYLPAKSNENESDSKAPAAAYDAPCKILVLEDGESIRSFLSRVFEKSGYTSVMTHDGSMTISEYRKAKESGKPFDIVMLDLTIPGGIGGKQVISELIQIDPSVKAIAASGYFNDSIMSDYKKYGFKARISKPFAINELKETITLLLENHS
jgi:PAS domain S-box-containing protein